MPPIKRGCQSCKLFPRLTEHTHILFDWEKIWICRKPVHISHHCTLPWGPITARDQAGIWKIWILGQTKASRTKKNLEVLDSYLLHRDVKTLLWSNSDPSGSNNLGRIIYDSVQEQITPKNVWDFPTWGPTREITDMPSSWLKTVPCNRLEIPPLIWIYSSYLLCPWLPVTC